MRIVEFMGGEYVAGCSPSTDACERKAGSRRLVLGRVGELTPEHARSLAADKGTLIERVSRLGP